MEQHTHVHGMTFAGEKAMHELLERIYRARIELLRNNQQPTAVYLGHSECQTIYMCAGTNDAISWRGFARDDRSKIFSMDVFEVDAETHMRVV